MSAECSSGNIPPGYKQTEVGVIPDDWDVCLLDSVANRGSGHTPDKSHPEYWGGNIKWISLQDSDRLDKLYIYDTAAKITPLGIKNSSAKMHLEGTVVLSRDAGVGKSAIMKEDMAVSQHFIAWKCGPLLNNHFLYYWLQSNKSEFERIAMGSTIKTIGLPYFRRLSIPLPTIGEQESISEALSDMDAFIESLEQLIAKKRQIKQGAMQELLTGKRRLPGFEIKKGYKHTEAGVIPDDWKVYTLGEIGKFKNGLNKDSQAFGHGSPFVNLMDVFGVNSIASKEQLGLVECTSFEQSIYDLRCGDVIFVRSSVKPSGVGLTVVVENDLDGTVYSGFLIRFRDDGFIDTTFKKYCFYEEGFRKAVIGNSSVSANTNINQDSLKRLSIPLPPTKAEQEAIAAILSYMDSEITSLEEKLAKALQIKQGMMQELLTGKIRLI